MASQNFVSISGITNRTQLQGIHKICQEEIFDFPIVIGYQVSNGSINRGTQNPKQPKFLDLGALSAASTAACATCAAIFPFPILRSVRTNMACL